MKIYFHIWRLTGWRHLLKDKLQTGIILSILALGVASFLSIRLANRAAIEGFSSFANQITGQSQWIIQRPANNTFDLNQATEIRDFFGALPIQIMPILEISAKLEANLVATTPPISTYKLISLDLVGLQNQIDSSLLVDEYQELARSQSSLLPRLWIAPQIAQERNFIEGDRLKLLAKDTWVDVIIGGILPMETPLGPVPPQLIITDLAELAKVSFIKDLISRLELTIPEGSRKSIIENELKTKLKDLELLGWQVIKPEDNKATGSSLTHAFRLNLLILSLISLLVGIYLIAQAMDTAVSRRRSEIGILRSLGLTQKQIKNYWLIEACAFGTFAALLGFFLGWYLSKFSISAVTTTTGALYQSQAGIVITPNITDFIWALIIGIAGSVLAGYFPAKDAAFTPPAQLLRRKSGSSEFPLFSNPYLGYLILVSGIALSFLPPVEWVKGSPFPLGGYISAFLCLIGGTLICAHTIVPFGSFLLRVNRNNAPWLLSSRSLSTVNSRHQLALAGTFIAIAMAMAMNILIHSFEKSVEGWLDSRLKADLFISSAGLDGGDSTSIIRQETLTLLAKDPSVKMLYPRRIFNSTIDDVPVFISGISFDEFGDLNKYLWLNKPNDLGTDKWNVSQTVGVINENLQFRLKANVGDFLTLETNKGIKRVEIIGLHSDFSSDRGILDIPISSANDWFDIDGATTLSLDLKDSTNMQITLDRLRNQFSGLKIRNQRELREVALQMFKQTFAITFALQWIAIVIAIAGLILTLIGILRDKRNELRMMRSLGMKRNEIAFTTAYEGLGISLLSSIFGALMSVGLGYLLIYVINRQSFGWTLQWHFPWLYLFQFISLFLCLAFACSFIVGYRYSKILFASNER